MAQRTLLTFMAAGAASGLLAGLLLLDDGSAITYVEGPSIMVDTDQRDYQKGEPVIVVIINSGNVPLNSEDSWSFRVSGLSGMLIYEELGDGPDTLNPRSEHAMVWNQVKNNGDPALEGLYRISVEWYGPDGIPVRDSTTFSIWK